MKFQNCFHQKYRMIGLLCLLLCGMLLLSACSGIKNGLLNNSNTELTTEKRSENNGSLHMEDPESILIRSDSATTESGSASNESLTIADVVRLVQDAEWIFTRQPVQHPQVLPEAV